MIDEPFQHAPISSLAIRLVGAMHRIGLLTENGLQATRAVWDGIEVDDSMHWSALHPLNVAVVQKLVDAGLRLDDDENAEAARFVCEHWIFPLYTLDLDMEEVAPADLQAARERRLAAEFGLTEDLAYYYDGE
jgi:hypothetical protein